MKDCESSLPKRSWSPIFKVFCFFSPFLQRSIAMNELEQFIIGLNKVQVEYKQKHNDVQLNEKIADYLFNGFGWNLLKSIYTQKVPVSVRQQSS